MQHWPCLEKLVTEPLIPALGVAKLGRGGWGGPLECTACCLPNHAQGLPIRPNNLHLCGSHVSGMLHARGVYPHWFRVASRSMLQAPATNQWCFAEARTFRSWDGLGTAVKLVEDMSPRGRGVSWDQGAWLMSQLALLPGTTGHAACFPTFVIFLMSGLPISAFACASFYACTH